MTRTTVTIAITAFNEARVIQKILRGLIKQEESNIVIERILVLDDQSTDATIKKAKDISDPRIQIQTFDTRVGKTGRVDDAYRLNTSEILILLDADCVPENDQTIEEFCRPFLADPEVMLVGGNAHCMPAKTLVGQGMNNLMESYDIIRRKLHDGDNIHACRGLNFAIRKSFAKTLTLPADVPFDDNYTYLTCKTRGLKFAYAHTSYVLYKTPQTISDIVRQGTRFQSNVGVLSRYFDPHIVQEAYRIPTSLRIQSVLFQIRKNPIAWIAIKIIGLYCFWKSRKAAKEIKGVWHQVER